MKKEPKEPKEPDTGELLPLVEQFYTIQGEGYHTGKPAYFLRIGGCDVGCSWCDTKFSWNAHLHPKVAVKDIIDSVMSSGAHTVVVTGGEPLIYNLDILCRELIKKGVQTFLETSGAHLLTGRWSWICLSPKKNMPPEASMYTLAHELKVIIEKPDDFEWAEKNAKRVNDSCRLFLQAEWSKYEEMIPYLVDYVKRNPRWSISLQAHKFMHIP